MTTRNIIISALPPETLEINYNQPSTGTHTMNT